MNATKTKFTKTSVLPPVVGSSSAVGHYILCLRASLGHSLTLMVRRQRIILAAVIVLLPVAIPLAQAFLSPSQFVESGLAVFDKMAREAHINTLAPLLALFFATMIIGEDVESRTIPLMLTRPMPRSAWVLGRFASYMIVSSIILGSSLFLTFAAATPMDKLAFDAEGLEYLLHYEFAMVMGLLANGALALFLGAATKRPIVFGVLFLYGWQYVATVVPGIVDFLTIKKYTNELLPVTLQAANKLLPEDMIYTKQEIYIGAGQAAFALVVITVVLLALSVGMVRFREYATDRAVGS